MRPLPAGYAVSPKYLDNADAVLAIPRSGPARAKNTVDSVGEEYYASPYLFIRTLLTTAPR